MAQQAQQDSTVQVAEEGGPNTQQEYCCRYTRTVATTYSNTNIMLFVYTDIFTHLFSLLLSPAGPVGQLSLKNIETERKINQIQK